VFLNSINLLVIHVGPTGPTGATGLTGARGEAGSSSHLLSILGGAIIGALISGVTTYFVTRQTGKLNLQRTESIEAAKQGRLAIKDVRTMAGSVRDSEGWIDVYVFAVDRLRGPLGVISNTELDDRMSVLGKAVLYAQYPPRYTQIGAFRAIVNVDNALRDIQRLAPMTERIMPTEAKLDQLVKSTDGSSEEDVTDYVEWLKGALAADA
jgi:hypothetical protein